MSNTRKKYPVIDSVYNRMCYASGAVSQRSRHYDIKFARQKGFMSVYPLAHDIFKYFFSAATYRSPISVSIIFFRVI